MDEKHVERYMALFCHRQDVHAIQKSNGSYMLVREPVTQGLVRRHLEGRITCGWYALREDSTVAWAALDADKEDGLQVLAEASQALNVVGIDSCLEKSRRGGHLWLFVESMPAIIPRRLVQQTLQQLDIDGIEVFPKQDELAEGGVGNLMRGPLGRHQRTGKRYAFLDPVTLKPLGRNLTEQLDSLMGVRVNTLLEVAVALARVVGGTTPRERELPPRPPNNNDNIAQLRATIGDLYDFVSQYVELDEWGRGSCPFHPPDRNPSFAVNRDKGYWVCFHEVNPETGRYLGGDAIEFYRRLKGLGFRQAVIDMAAQYGFDDLPFSQ